MTSIEYAKLLEDYSLGDAVVEARKRAFVELLLDDEFVKLFRAFRDRCDAMLKEREAKKANEIAAELPYRVNKEWCEKIVEMVGEKHEVDLTDALYNLFMGAVEKKEQDISCLLIQSDYGRRMDWMQQLTEEVQGSC